MTDYASNVGVEVVEQFYSAEQQRHVATLGIWAFLATELLLFSGMFMVALILRVMHPASVTAAALHLKYWIGATNTAVLIVSSFTMSLAIESSKAGLRRVMIRFLLVTAALGTLFLCLKGYEWFRDWAEHMMPFIPTRRYELAGDPASRLFIFLYYMITGLHGLHLTVGVGLVLGFATLARHEDYLMRHQNRIEILGLYWHFIDIVWMIVFPTLYLLNR